MTDPNLVALVREAMENAAENDYDLSEWSDHRVACDIADCTDIARGHSIEEVEAAVRDVRRAI